MSKITQNTTDLLAILEAVKALPDAGGGSGGSTPSASWDDVTFIDYDGTVLYSYTTAEAQSLTELPPLPEHEGLICQGWNYDLATIKEYNRPVTVGSMYITDDGKTRIYITLHEGRTSPMLGVCPNGTVTVDWGDGTTPDTLTGTSTATVQWTPTHNYAAPGDYVISLTVDGTIGLRGASLSNQSSYLLRYASGTDTRNIVYQNSIHKIEVGNGVTTIGGYAFSNCHSLSIISMPNSITVIGDYAFYNCYSLSSISIPNSVEAIGTRTFYCCFYLSSISMPNSITSIMDETFNNCYSLSSISIPNSITSIGNYAFFYCYSLSSISIPNSITSIGSYAFYYCYSLSSISIPNSITSIGANAFYNCYSLSSISIPNSVEVIRTNTFGRVNGVGFYDFTQHTAVPALENTNAFSGIPADCEIRVHAALYEEWKAAANWSTYASQIVAV